VHEVGVMQQALDIAVENARRSGGERIHRMTLRIGDLSGVVPEALSFAFDVVTQDTPAEGAELILERVPALCYCSTCQRTFEPAIPILDCPTCSCPSGDIRQGREIDLTSVEIS